MPAAAHADRPSRSNPIRPRWSAPALIVITPAVSQFVVFFGTLIFFLATNVDAAAASWSSRS